MKLGYKDITKNDWFLVSWTLSNKCNYRCEYCPDILHNGSTGQPRWETVERFIKNLKVNKDVCFRISGGEPTYWKHFIDMAECVKEQGHKFSFVSNGSQSPEYFKRIAPYTDAMMLSYHKAYADPDHFIKVINESKITTVINMMLLPDDFDEAFSISEKIFSSTANATIWPKVIVDKTYSDNITNEVVTYTDKQKDLIKNVVDKFKDTDFAVTDLSHSRAIIEIEGNDTIEVLKKGCPFNFDTLDKNNSINSTYNGIAFTVDRLSDNPNKVRIFALRSFGESLYHSITDASLEFGFETI